MNTGKVRCLLLCLIATLAGCGSSPSRQQSELLQLARQADRNYETGKFDLARTQYEAVVAANPKFVPGHVRLGVIAYHDGDSKAAQAHFEQASTLDPRNQQAKYNLAMLHLNEVTMLLDDYATSSPQAANRQHVLTLLGHLREFGARP